MNLPEAPLVSTLQFANKGGSHVHSRGYNRYPIRRHGGHLNLLDVSASSAGAASESQKGICRQIRVASGLEASFTPLSNARTRTLLSTPDLQTT